MSLHCIIWREDCQAGRQVETQKAVELKFTGFLSWILRQKTFSGIYLNAILPEEFGYLHFVRFTFSHITYQPLEIVFISPQVDAV